MKTKLIIFTLIIVLILSIAPLTYSATEDNVTLTSSASTVQVGDTVTITLTFSQKVQAADFKIKFSSDILKFKSTLSSITLDEDYTVRDGEIQYCLAKNSGVDSIPITFDVIKLGNANVSTDIENLNIDTTSKLEFTNKTVGITVKENNTTVDVTSVTLDKTMETIEVGATTKLTATVLPANATDTTVVWTSSNTSVATVSNGTVTGMKSGTTVITAKAGNKTATCTITVTNKKTDEPTKIEVTSIKLDKTAISLKVNETAKLIATIEPSNATDKTLDWKSSDTSIVTVTNGTIKGIKEGKAVITVALGSKSANCEITVTKENSNAGDSGKVPEKDTTIPNKDTTIAKDPIPQTGENYAIIGISLIIAGIGAIAIIKYRRYRDI